MIDKIKFEETIFRQINESHYAIELKLQELEILLLQTEVDSEKLKYYRQRIEESFEKKELNDNLKAYEALDEQTNLSQTERLDQLIQLLAEHPVDSTIAHKKSRSVFLKKIIIFIIGVLMIAIGFAMIVLPAPPDFEMFTIFYFSRNDGVTIMDLISLLIIFSGVFLLVSNVKRKTV